MDPFSLSFFRLICPFHDRSSPGTFCPEYKKVYLKQIVNVKITKNSFITGSDVLIAVQTQIC